MLAAGWTAVLLAVAIPALGADPAPAQPDAKVIQSIYDCLAAGLPKDWKEAWVTVHQLKDTGKERQFEADFLYSTRAQDTRGEPLHPCDSQRVVQEVLSLNSTLSPEQRRWTSTRVTFGSDGKFAIQYNYAPGESGHAPAQTR